MQLKKWLKQNQIKQREFARLIDTTDAKISLICNGHSAGSPEIIDRISKATNMQVCACDIHRHYLETRHPAKPPAITHTLESENSSPAPTPSPAIQELAQALARVLA